MRIGTSRNVELVPVCFKGELSSMKIYSKPGVVGYCSVYSGPIGNTAESELVAQLEGKLGTEVESVQGEAPVSGDYGLWISTDANVSTVHPIFKAVTE